MAHNYGEPISTAIPNITAEQRARLRELFPEAFTGGKIDFEKLRAALGDLVDDGPERYQFTWAGKRDAMRLLQTPTRATLVPCREESLNFDQTQHLFTEGDNLEVLKLLYKAYFGRVKMIYIDPPYNTGNDFIYPDNYADPLATYLQLTGQQDAEGNLLTSNPETSGRYHSAWLSMMYPRLFLARQLLREDGVIFVSVDDNEVHNLRLLMNEVFGEENFIAQLVWKSRQFTDTRAVTNISTDHEYILAYARQGDFSFRGTERDESKFSNPDNDPRGLWMSRSILGLATIEQRPNLHYDIVDPQTDVSYSPPTNTGWRYSRERMQELIEDGRILFPSDPDGRPREKKFRADLLNEYISFPSIIDDIFTANGTAEIREMFGFQMFDFPKPSELMRRLVEQVTAGDDFVLDFFAGSNTLAEAVFRQNRQDGERRRFICIQLPEPLGEESEVARRGFSTVADIGKERIRRVIARMERPPQSGRPRGSPQRGEADQLALDLASTSDDSRGGPCGRPEERPTPEDLGFKVFKLAPSNIRAWRGVEEDTPDAYAQQMEIFRDPLVDGWTVENVIYEVALKEGYGLNCRIEPVSAATDNTIYYRVTDPDKEQAFTICLDSTIDLTGLNDLNLSRDDTFICRDVALDDEAAANLALQCRLKTI
jgi:adenine-specific DNA-methyltransferase